MAAAGLIWSFAGPGGERPERPSSSLLGRLTSAAAALAMISLGLATIRRCSRAR